MNKLEFSFFNKHFTISMSWFLILFILLNLFFKCLHLPEESIYGDEAYSIFHAQKSLGELTDIFLNDQNPPLHIILLHFWMQIFGVSDISAKGFSILLSTLCGIVLFIFANKYINKQASILVSVLFLFSNAQFFYSQEVRTYALVQLLCISSFYYYFKLLKEPDKKSLLLLTLINLLLLFSHYLTIFIFVTQFLCIWMFYKNNRQGLKYYLISQILTALLFSPWLKVLFSNLPKSGSFWLTAPTFGELKWFLYMLNGSEWLFTIFTVIIVSSLLMVIFNKRFRFFSQSFDVKLYIIFFSLYVLPIALDYWVAQYTPVFLGRYFLYSTLGLFLLLAYVLSNLNMSKHLRFIISLPILYSLIVAFNIKPEKEDNWKYIIPKIKKLQTENTLIYISASYKYKDFSFYYDREAFKDYKNTIQRLFHNNVFCSKEGPFGWDQVNLDTIDQVIFIQSHSQFEDPEGKTKKLLLGKFKVCNEYTHINITYTVFKKDSLPCSTFKTLSEEKTTACDFWTRALTLNEQTQDTIVIYKTGMETDSTCPATPLITEEKSRSGAFSCKINKEQQFSIGINKSVSELDKPLELDISGFINLEPGSDPRLVTSVEKNGEILYRQELEIIKKQLTSDKWHQIVMSVNMPVNLPEDSDVKVYFWNPAEASAFIDDFSVQVATEN